MEENSSSRRRRGPGVVTANACTECRKKRAKCDGQTPCSRCVTVKAECIYEIPVRQSKETMRAEIDALQSHRRQSERVFSALTTGYHTQETLNRLRNGEPLETIAEWLDQNASRAEGSSQKVTTFLTSTNASTFDQTLKLAESVGNFVVYTGPETSDELPGQQIMSPWQSGNSNSNSTPIYSQSEDVMNWTPTPHTSSQSGSEEPANITRPLIGTLPQISPDESALLSARSRGQQQVFGPSYTDQKPQTSQYGVSSTTWTKVTNDIHLVEHLIALYFCWEYPTFASLSKEDFLEDFRAGRPRYCSSLLVNAMLALGCRFSNLPESRADPSNPATGGDHFLAEAKRLLVEDDRNSLTCIQAIGLISIREASYGHDSESLYYAGQAIRLAVEAGLHRKVDHSSGNMLFSGSDSVRSATFWGAFSLDQAWSLNIGKISHFSRTAKLVAKPAIIHEVESSDWVPYTDDGIPDIKYASQPSNVRSVYKCFCELAELVHQTLHTLYTPGKRLTTSEILALYTWFLNWYSSLPEALRLGHNFTPAVLFAHMYYHFAILLLFRPFIKLRFIGSRVSPRDVCSQAADAIITLVRSYDQLYSLARTPSFVPYIVTASCIMHLVRMASQSTISSSGPALTQFRQGVRDLKAMTDCHGFTTRALNNLRFFAERWDLGKALGDDRMSYDDLQAAVAPTNKSFNFFCPSVRESLHNADLLGPSMLFAPYPKQGLPLLADEDEMENDGFSRLSQ